MKHQWLAYVIVALLSIGAGVAIAGLPDNVPVDATIIPPTTTVAPEPTVPSTTEAPSTTAPPSTAAPDTTEPETTEPTESVPAALPDRSELTVVSANGANVAGAAARVASELETLGYVGVLPLNGTDIVQFTTVYYAAGLEEAALRLADDLDLLPEFVAPIEDAPVVVDLPPDGTQLVVYVGRDRI